MGISAMSEVNTNLFNQQTSLLDASKLQQDFMLKKQAATLANATAANALKYQTIAAGAQSGAQGLAVAKAKLADLGIDASEYSDDPTVAAAQSLQAQKAASPYGTLFNAQQKVIGNNVAAAGVFGDVNNPYAQPTPVIPGEPTQPPAPRPATAPTPAPVASPANNNMTVGDNAPIPANMGNTQPEPPVVINGTPAGNMPAPSVAAPAAASQPPIVNMQLPIRNPNETQAAYEARPDVIYAKTVAPELAKAGVKAATEAATSQETNNRLQPNFQALRDINNQVPDNAYGIPPSVKEWLSSANPFGDHEWAKAGGLWDTVNEQQVLNALQQLVAGGQIRSNRQIAKMLETGNFVPENIPSEGRLLLINTIAAESQNLATSSANVAAKINGGVVQPYVQTVPSTGVNTPNLQADFNAKKGVVDYRDYFK